MKRAIVVHGLADKEGYSDPNTPSPSNDNWIPWLSKQLIINDIHVVAPEMPEPTFPKYNLWKEEFEMYKIDEETTLIGHSCGAAFLVRWLGENSAARVDKLVLVAPSLGLSWENRSFFEFEIDPEVINRTNSAIIFSATNDRESTIKALEIYKEKLPTIKHVELQAGGHFTRSDMGTEEFPELLEEILR